MARPRVLVALVDRWRKRGLKAFLTANGFHVVARVPAVVLTDAGEADTRVAAYDAVLRVRTRWPGALILSFVTELDVSHVSACLEAGASGVLQSDAYPEVFVAAIRSVLRGEIWAPRKLMAHAIDRLAHPQVGITRPSGRQISFTPPENRVLCALRDELLNKEIASLLQVSESTVKFHVRKLLRKTRTKNRHELRQIALRQRPSS